jgi:hypothetical protein
MTDFQNLLRGGESGAPAVVPGNPDESYLIQQITPERGRAAMPKRKRPLADADISLIRRWIAEGALDDSAAGTPPDAYRDVRSVPYDSVSSTIDTSYVSPTAMAVLAIRPAQIMNTPMAQLLPIELFTAYFGFDPSGVEEVVAFVDPINLVGPTTYGVTFKFTAPFRATSIGREWRAQAQLSEFAGKRYLQGREANSLSFFGPNNRTLLVAPDATLRRLVETKDQPKAGALIDRLRAVPAGNDLYLLIDIAPLRPFAQMGIDQAKASGRIPPPLQKYADVPQLVSAAELTFNLSEAGPMALVLHAADEAAAGQLESLLVDAAEAGENSRFGYESAGNPLAQAVTQYTQRVSQPFRPQRVGNSVTMFHLDSQNPARQQLASVAVLGLQVAIQAARNAAQLAATPSAAPAGEDSQPRERAETTDSREFRSN